MNIDTRTVLTDQTEGKPVIDDAWSPNTLSSNFVRALRLEHTKHLVLSIHGYFFNFVFLSYACKIVHIEMLAGALSKRLMI